MIKTKPLLTTREPSGPIGQSLSNVKKSDLYDVVYDKAKSVASKSDLRFYDNRQKYLMFVNTCAEKVIVADRVAQEIARLVPKPPALRFFDAGVGDGTVLSRVMRDIHTRFSRYPLLIVGKEISLEDVRLTLDKMPDRFLEHPETVLAITNLPYTDAPWLVPSNFEAEARMTWKEVALDGTTSAAFEKQILSLRHSWLRIGEPKSAKRPVGCCQRSRQLSSCIARIAHFCWQM